jgi:hypothetical protein
MALGNIWVIEESAGPDVIERRFVLEAVVLHL